MAQDTYVLGEKLQVTGQIKSDLGNLSSDGTAGTLTTVGLVTTNLNVANQFGGITGGAAGASVTTSGTISTATRTTKVTTGSAVTVTLPTEPADGTGTAKETK